MIEILIITPKSQIFVSEINKLLFPYLLNILPPKWGTFKQMDTVLFRSDFFSWAYRLEVITDTIYKTNRLQ